MRREPLHPLQLQEQDGIFHFYTATLSSHLTAVPTFGESMDPLEGVLGRVLEDMESLLLDVEWFMLARPDWV